MINWIILFAFVSDSISNDNCTCDVAVLVDASYSIEISDWPHVGVFIDNLVSSNSPRIGFIMYNNVADIMGLGISNDKVFVGGLAKKYPKCVSLSCSGTYTFLGLERSMQMLANKSGNCRIFILITDGFTFPEKYSTQTISNAKRFHLNYPDVEKFAFGVGIKNAPNPYEAINMKELNAIASCPKNAILIPAYDEIINYVSIIKQCPSSNCRRTKSSILGDPHFVGLSGGRYSIDLVANRCYVLFTSTRFQWNSCAIQLGHRPISYLGSMGFWLDNTSIILPHVVKPPLCIIINQTLTLCADDSYRTFNIVFGGFQIRLFRNVMLLNTPCIRLRIDIHSRRHSVKEGTHHNQYYSRRKLHSHFNVIIQSTSPSLSCSRSHGLIGVTMNKPAVVKGKNGKGVIEGHLVEYEVSNVLSTQFKYTLFQH